METLILRERKKRRKPSSISLTKTRSISLRKSKTSKLNMDPEEESSRRIA
jgi:hypothetical protein